MILLSTNIFDLIAFSLFLIFIKNQTIELSIKQENPFRLNALKKRKKKLRKKEKKTHPQTKNTIMTSSQGSLDRLRCYEKKRKKKKNRVIRKLFSRESTHGPDRLPLTT